MNSRRSNPVGDRTLRGRRGQLTGLATLGLIAAGCATSERTIQADAQQRWDEYRAAVKYELANEELRGGNPERAIALAREAGALAPDRASNAELLAKGYLARGDFSSARRVLEAARRAFDDSGELHYLMGVVHQRDRNWKSAVEAYSAAAAAAPTQLHYHIATAQATARSSPALAIETLAAHANRFKFDTLFHLALAELKRGRGDIEGACRSYGRAMELGADDRDTRESAAMCHYQLERFELAADLLAQLVGEPGSASRLLPAFARCLMETGAMEQAVVRLEHFVERRADHAGAWLLLAEAKAKRGEIEPALAAASRAAALETDSSDAHLLLAALHVAAYDPAAGLTSIGNAIEADPSSADAYVLLGRIFEQLNDPALALEAYRQVVRIDPRHEIASRLIARLID